MLLKKIQQRLDVKSQQGFTLIELLVVIIIIGILLAIAVPSYLGFRERANESAAQANVRSAITAVEAYSADNTGEATDADGVDTTVGYEGMTTTLLRTIDAGLSNTVAIGATAPTETYYCIQSSVSTADFYYQVGSGTGTNGAVTAGTCP